MFSTRKRCVSHWFQKRSFSPQNMLSLAHIDLAGTVGRLADDCGARAVSRKTPIYFFRHFYANVMYFHYFLCHFTEAESMLVLSLMLFACLLGNNNTPEKSTSQNSNGDLILREGPSVEEWKKGEKLDKKVCNQADEIFESAPAASAPLLPAGLLPALILLTSLHLTFPSSNFQLTNFCFF